MSPSSAKDDRRHRSRRTDLRPPLHLAASLLRYEPLGLGEPARGRPRAATQLGKLDPADEALDDQTFASWLRAHGQSQNAIDSLWNLIALPTLNLPAEDASLAVAAKVFRDGLLDQADASDIGVPTVPFRLLHADPAAAAIEAAGGRVHASAPVRAVSRERRLTLEAGTDDADAVILAVPHEAVAEVAPPGTVDAVSLAGLGTSPIVNIHVHYDRRVLAEPLAAALGSPVQWLFDRTEEPRGRARGSSWRSRSPTPSTRSGRRCPSSGAATCRRSSGCCRPPRRRRGSRSRGHP